MEANPHTPPTPEGSEVKIAVRAILVNQDGQILITRRVSTGKFAGLWSLPGGKWDEGESFPATAYRETKEELGISIKPVFFTTSYNKTAGQTWYSQFFYSQINEPLYPDATEIADIAWVNQEDLAKYEIGFGHAEVITKFFKYLEVHAQ